MAILIGTRIGPPDSPSASEPADEEKWHDQREGFADHIHELECKARSRRSNIEVMLSPNGREQQPRLRDSEVNIFSNIRLPDAGFTLPFIE
jgi:hypothetical protein